MHLYKVFICQALLLLCIFFWLSDISYSTRFCFPREAVVQVRKRPQTNFQMEYKFFCEKKIIQDSLV